MSPYLQSIETFVKHLNNIGKGVVTYDVGRKFTRIVVNGKTFLFVENATWDVYGAKSNHQYNSRRWYGDVSKHTQMDWIYLTPVPGTELEQSIQERESMIASTYKPRGRPRKN